MPAQERLFLLDGMALAYRAYFALISRPLRNSKGENTSAIYGFVMALMKILDDEKPEHIAVVFDARGPTFRHLAYAEYKATRQKMPEDMASQMDKLKEVVRAFNVPLIEVPGFEADDVIGTLARRAEKEKVLSYLVTGDKDFMQLISPLIKMYKPGKSGGDVEIVDDSGVEKKFGVQPDKVIEVLGLIGDTSDNVPGVKGIGEKTAIPLIQKYGSIPELYEHLEEIPQKGVREKLRGAREMAFLSRDLVTIKTDVPLDLDFHELRASQRDTVGLIRLFGELEFKSLAGRLRESGQGLPVIPAASPAPGSSDPRDINSTQHTYSCITTAAALKTLCKEMAKASVLVVDTEATGTDSLRSELVGIALCWKEGEAYYIPMQSEQPQTEYTDGLFAGTTTVSKGENNTSTALSRTLVLDSMRPIFEDPRIKKVGQNIKYDMLILRSHGVEIKNVCFDSMVASYVIRADGQHNLDALALEYCNYRTITYQDLTGTGRNQKHITGVPLEALADYSAEDADITLQVYKQQLIKLKELELLDLCETVEFPLITVLADMEFAGIALDGEYLEAMSKDLEKELEGLVSEIYKAAGVEFNINSTQQLADILFQKLGLPTVRKTKTGFSTDVGVLESLRNAHPVIEKLLAYRQLTKLKSTYIDALPQLINPKTGRVHTSFNQTVAATGRLSSSDPNLQNIPIRTELGSSIRKAFIAAPGNALLSADYSQIELRIMAHICGDEGLLEAFRNKEDVHATTAAKVFGVEPGEITRDMRRKAKEVNFGIMYGIGPFGLANRLEISQGEAKEIIGRYFERFPKVKQYINTTIDSARRMGYVSTLLGRRRYLPDINSRNQNIRGNAERQAINMPIQGTAADMIKVAMIAINKHIRREKLSTRMLLQVHDELVFEVPEKEGNIVREIVLNQMQGALKLDVPIEVDVGMGITWLDAH